MNIIIELKLKLLLSSRIIIYSNINIIIDLIWRFNEVTNRMIIYQIVKEHDHDSNHLSIEITIVMRIEESQHHLSYNYAKTNWKKLIKRLKIYLSKSINKKTTTIDIDNYIKQLIEIIIKMMQEITSRKRSNSYSKY